MITSFKTVPINIVGPSGEHRDSSYNSQITMNLIPEINQTGASNAVAISWPGSKLFATVPGETNRGIWEFGDSVYKVNDNTLYRVRAGGLVTEVGFISGTGKVVMRDNGAALFIASGEDWFKWDLSTLTNYSGNAPSGFAPQNSLDFLNGAAVYDGPNGQYAMSLVGDPTSFQLPVLRAESSPDDLKRIYYFHERVYLMGSRTIETHYFDGNRDPNMQKTLGGTMQVGLKDTHSVAQSKNFVYFRGSDGWVYRFSGTQALNITSGSAAHAFEEFAEDTAVGWVIEIEGGTHYVISFLGNNQTWAFSEKNHRLSPGSEDWFQLSTGENQARYIGEMYVRAFNKHLIAAKAGGDILELDLNLFEDNGDHIVRVREIAPITGSAMGAPGQRLEMSWFRIVCKKGVGLNTGQGVDPRFYFQGSFDGANSYSNEEQVEVGRTGDSMIKTTWYFTRSFYEATIRITVYDPIFTSMYDASIGLKVVGD